MILTTTYRYSKSSKKKVTEKLRDKNVGKKSKAELALFAFCAFEFKKISGVSLVEKWDLSL